MRIINKITLGYIALALLPISFSHSSETQIETIVVTAGRYEQDISQRMESISVVDNDVLRKSGNTHIQQSLVSVPGANLARGNGQEYLPALRSPVLTGAGACGGLLTAEDGIPLRANGFCNINELFESFSETARHVEVVRGPAGTLYGSNAMHGLINVISRDPVEGENGSLNTEAGPHDYYRLGVSADHRLSSEGDVISADLYLMTDGGYRDQSGLDQQKASIQYTHQVGDSRVRTRLVATSLKQETAGYLEGDGVYRNRRLSRINPNPEAFRDANSLRFYSLIDIPVNQTSQLHLAPYLRKTDMRFLQHYLPGQPMEENGQESVGIRSGYYLELGEKLNLLTGIDTELSKGYLLEAQESVTEGSEFLQATIPMGKHYDYEVVAWNVAPYASATWKVNDQLEITGGVRIESAHYDYDNQMLPGRTDENGLPCDFGGCRFSRPNDRKDSFNNISPKLGALLWLSNELQLFTQLAQGYRVPQATELYRLQREQTVADLDPEEINSFEVGLRKIGDSLSYEWVAYTMKKENVIFRDADYFNQSNGKTRHWGVELAVDYEFTESLRLEVSTSYAEHRYADQRELQGVELDGKLVDSAPKTFGNYRLHWSPNSLVSAEFEWLHQGSYFTDPQNAYRYPGHDLLNLHLAWQWKQYQISTRILNITDKAYAERADYSSFSGSRYFPGEPRSIYFGINFDW
ncbi:TonB-dependent receptor [Microbulbifer sp. TRSA007]|uniref:TonB-dependent receptor n=1 Tax=Microbulbifer sp. TRSA007 TaxID=3243384 RepID=UPI00403A1564